MTLDLTMTGGAAGEELPEKGKVNFSGVGGGGVCDPHRNYGTFSF